VALTAIIEALYGISFSLRQHCVNMDWNAVPAAGLLPNLQYSTVQYTIKLFVVQGTNRRLE